MDKYGEVRNSRLINYLIVAGTLSIGALIGCLVAGVTIERFGRKFTLMVLTSSCYFLGFLSIFLANSAYVIFLGR